MKPKILILGLGNVLLSDEGLGCRLIRELEEEFSFPPQVELLEGGTGAFFLLPYLEKAALLIILDAIKASQPPGTIYLEPLENLPSDTLEKISLHEVSFPDLLNILALKGKTFKKIYLAGIEPECLEVGDRLSPTVEKAIPLLKERLLLLLKEFGVDYSFKTKAP